MFNNFAIIFVLSSAVLYGTLAFKFDRLYVHNTMMSRSYPKPNEYPYMAAILANGAFHCNGVIISNQIVLTTAACVLDKINELQHVTIRTGSNHPWRGGQIHNVEKYYVHSVNITEIEPGVMHLIGAFKLSSRVNINSNQQTIKIGKLPEEIYEEQPTFSFFRGDWPAALSGFGKAQFETDTSLKRAEVQIARIPNCKKSLAFEGLSYYDHNICAYHNDLRIGNDSSVLVYKNSLIGLAAYSRIDVKTTSGLPHPRVSGSVFIYVHKVNDFVDRIVQNP
ncbi:hypodermin-A-like [Prorops nasuta]|uniref:hypodermin-A-like n=1 Tax=Prorops nasuta TaxID=863751 RepID=UPI0034CF35DB